MGSIVGAVGGTPKEEIYDQETQGGLSEISAIDIDANRTPTISEVFQASLVRDNPLFTDIFLQNLAPTLGTQEGDNVQLTPRLVAEKVSGTPYEAFYDDLAFSTDGFDLRLRMEAIDSFSEMQSVQDKATFLQLALGGVGSALLNPINAVPAGRIASTVSGGLGKAALNTGVRIGAETGLTEAVTEAILLQQQLGTRTLEESMVNVATAGVLGGAIGTGASIYKSTNRIKNAKAANADDELTSILPREAQDYLKANGQWDDAVKARVQAKENDIKFAMDEQGNIVGVAIKPNIGGDLIQSAQEVVQNKLTPGQWSLLKEQYGMARVPGWLKKLTNSTIVTQYLNSPFASMRKWGSDLMEHDFLIGSKKPGTKLLHKWQLQPKGQSVSSKIQERTNKADKLMVKIWDLYWHDYLGLKKTKDQSNFLYDAYSNISNAAKRFQAIRGEIPDNAMDPDEFFNEVSRKLRDEDFESGAPQLNKAAALAKDYLDQELIDIVKADMLSQEILGQSPKNARGYLTVLYNRDYIRTAEGRMKAEQIIGQYYDDVNARLEDLSKTVGEMRNTIVGKSTMMPDYLPSDSLEKFDLELKKSLTRLNDFLKSKEMLDLNSKEIENLLESAIAKADEISLEPVKFQSIIDNLPEGYNISGLKEVLFNILEDVKKEGTKQAKNMRLAQDVATYSKNDAFQKRFFDLAMKDIASVGEKLNKLSKEALGNENKRLKFIQDFEKEFSEAGAPFRMRYTNGEIFEQISPANRTSKILGTIDNILSESEEKLSNFNYMPKDGEAASVLKGRKFMIPQHRLEPITDMNILRVIRNHAQQVSAPLELKKFYASMGVDKTGKVSEGVMYEQLAEEFDSLKKELTNQQRAASIAKSSNKENVQKDLNELRGLVAFYEGEGRGAKVNQEELKKSYPNAFKYGDSPQQAIEALSTLEDVLPYFDMKAKDLDKLINELDKKVSKLTRDFKKEKAKLDATLQIMLGSYDNGSAMYNSVKRAFFAMRMWQVITKMGGAILSSLAEPFIYIPQAGLRSFMTDFVRTGWDMFKGGLTGNRKEYLDDIHDLGYGYDSIMGRMYSMLMKTDQDSQFKKTGAERLLMKGANITGTLNGLRAWTDANRSAAGRATSSWIIRQAVKKAEGTPLKKRDTERLMRLGLSDNDMNRIYEQWKRYGNSETSLVDKFYQAGWSQWDDQEIAQTFKSAIRNGVRQIIMTPDAFGKPFFASKFWGKNLLQFRTVMFELTNRILLSGFGQRRDLDFYAGLVPFALAATAQYMLRTYLAGRETADNPVKFALEVLGSTGSAGILFEAMASGDKFFGISSNGFSRFTNRSAGDLLLGASMSWLNSLSVAGKLLNVLDGRETLNKYDVSTISSNIPWIAKHPLTRIYTEEFVGSSLGIRGYE